MPISTPEVSLPLYHGDKDHFQHVLECLFFPAIEKAGLKPIAPIAKGADVIHAEIIRNLEAADLVLCDMSSLNANVFFELGIRTALAKPVCIVKDDSTPKVPFDMTVVNYHTYMSALHAWNSEREIETLSEHIRHSLDRSQGTNMLWRYFSMHQRAEISISKDPTNERLALMMVQMEGLSKKIDFLENTTLVPLPTKTRRCDLFLISIPGEKKEGVIEFLQAFTGANLSTAKTYTEKLPFRLLTEAPENYVVGVRKALEDLGAVAAIAVVG
jgi:ribosomal protein L7/L12